MMINIFPMEAKIAKCLTTFFLEHLKKKKWREREMKFSSIYKLINQVSLLFPDKRLNKSLTFTEE